jgi:hypothetical protein
MIVIHLPIPLMTPKVSMVVATLVATLVATVVATLVVVTAVAEAGNDGRNGCLRAHALHNTPQIDAQLAKDDLSRIPARRHGDARARMTAGTTQVDVGNGSLVAA